MSETNETVPGMAETEKLRTQAETGGERSVAWPGNASGAGGVQPGATSGMSGGETNEGMPGGGATGDREQPDTVPTDR